MFEQAEPDAYLPDDIPTTKRGKKMWRLRDLPVIPTEWKTLVRKQKGVKGQLSVIGKLIRSSAVIVNAGDPDREGQLLVDEVLEHFRVQKPVKRFWVSAIDPASIKKGLAALKENQGYAGMRDAARARSRADWLLGMNLSRAYTLTGPGGLIAVGRVQTPTLAMVARRDYAVRHFVPKPYLAITANLAKDGAAFRAKWQPKPGQPGMDEEGTPRQGKDRDGSLRGNQAKARLSAQGLFARRHSGGSEPPIRLHGRGDARGLSGAL